jgi:hypothetical protein
MSRPFIIRDSDKQPDGAALPLSIVATRKLSSIMIDGRQIYGTLRDG